MIGAGIGLMLTPNMGYTPEYARAAPRWAADTGCYSRGEQFDLGAYLAWLDGRAAFAATCLFATAPDVVADAPATLARSLPVLPLIRARGYTAAFVAQDGQEALPVPWDALDALFIGGSTAWKLGAAAAGLVAEARRRGKWVHMGRVNSGRRLLYAAAVGCQSADGTYMAFDPTRAVDQMTRWLATARAQLVLPGTLQEGS
jgi:hypothetical protein